MKHEESISLALVNELLTYEPETGLFYWKWRKRRTWENNIFNAKYAGKIAGSRAAQGYLRIILDHRYVMAHRVAFLIMTGSWPSNQIDHINGTRDDNRWCNLREATLTQNNRNSSKQVNNRSGFKGVSWKERNQKWVAQISVENRKIHIGLFETPQEAHEAYMRAARAYHGEFARAA